MPGGGLEISADASHPGAFLIGVAESVSVVGDMNLVARQFLELIFRMEGLAQRNIENRLRVM